MPFQTGVPVVKLYGVLKSVPPHTLLQEDCSVSSLYAQDMVEGLFIYVTNVLLARWIDFKSRRF